MTHSTKELVRVFKAQGGKTTHIPRGCTGIVKYKSFFKIARAYSHRTKEIRQLRLDAAAHGREKRGVGPTAAVDVFMQFRNEKGI